MMSVRNALRILCVWMAGGLGVALPLAGWAQRLPPRGDLPLPVLQAAQRAGLPEAALAVAVLPLGLQDDGQPPGLLIQPDRPMQPASAMKVVTSVVALNRLGPDHRSHTELRTVGPILEQGRLPGELILRGGADPELTLPALWGLLLQAREAGLKTIEGDIVLDRTLFVPARMDIGVPPFDESPEFPYNMIPDALQLAGNLHAIELQSDGRSVQARLSPALPGVRLDNKLELHADASVPCREWSTRGWRPPQARVDSEGQITVLLHGRYPQNCRQLQPMQLMERNLLAQAQLRWLLLELGIAWSGRVREALAGEYDGPTGKRSELLARREARPWGEWLRPINKVSDNVATRLLYLLTGLEEARRAAEGGKVSSLPSSPASSPPSTPPSAAPGTPAGTTKEWADRAVRRWFADHGIDTTGLVMDNGSGLSRQERITPRQLALLLRAAHAQMHASDLLMSLPIAGVNGSLRTRMVDTPAQGRARLKPGTLRNAVALAGYVDDPQGRRWVLAAMVNHDEAPQRGRAVLDALAAWVAAGQPR